MKKNYMFTPGPTTVPFEVLLAEAAPMIHHRTPEFSGIMSEVVDGLKVLFGTKEDVYVIVGSGTSAMEAAVVNTCSPGDRSHLPIGPTRPFPGTLTEYSVQAAHAYHPRLWKFALIDLASQVLALQAERLNERHYSQAV